MKITRPAMRRIYQAYLIKNNNCSSSEKKICSLASHHFRATCGDPSPTTGRGPCECRGCDRYSSSRPRLKFTRSQGCSWLTVHRSDDAPCSRRVIIASCPKIDIHPCWPRLKILNIKHTLDWDSDILLDWTSETIYFTFFYLTKILVLAERGCCIEQTFLKMTNCCWKKEKTCTILKDLVRLTLQPSWWHRPRDSWSESCVVCHASCHVMLVTVRLWVPGAGPICREQTKTDSIVSPLALLFTGSPLDRISKTGSLWSSSLVTR